jgi:putative mRNA 3-end processing factor
MISPFEHRSEGLYFKPGDFYIDPRKGVEKAVVSHAHADHANPNNIASWCTPATAHLMQSRYGSRLKSKLQPVSFDTTFEINGVEIHFVPAGHMLGSAQIVLDYLGVRYCYTGDFKLRSDDSCEPCRVVSCDVLVTETTFATPGHIHPDESEEFEKLRQFSNCRIVIGAYNMGKAQRLTLLANRYFPDRPVMVHPEAARFHHIYSEHGFQLGPWEFFEARRFRQLSSAVLIVPPRGLSTYYRSPGTVTAFATGWKKSPFRAHINFHLSDHADWDEVLQMIKGTGAKEIMTVHGEGHHLRNYLQMKNEDYKVLI